MGGISNIDVKMEITLNIFEDFSSYNKQSLQSSPDIQNNYLHPTKHLSIVPSPLESLTHKKQAINSDSLCLSQPFGHENFKP